MTSKFWDSYVNLCNEKGLTPTTAMKKMGISTGNISRWQHGGMPSGEMLLVISKFFNRSIDYILTGEDFNKNDERRAENTSELSMLLSFRSLPPELQATALSYVKGLSDAYAATMTS